MALNGDDGLVNVDYPAYIQTLRTGGVGEKTAMTHARAIHTIITPELATRHHVDGVEERLSIKIDHLGDILRREIQISMYKSIGIAITGISIVNGIFKYLLP